jgi:hypothetical protein
VCRFGVISSVKCNFDYLLHVVDVVNFRIEFNFALLETAAVLDKYLNSYRKKAKNNETSSSKDIGSSSSREMICKNLKARNMIQSIFIFDSQILMLVEKRGHNI